MTDQELKALLQTKKAETPGQVYFSQFLTEFHRYQRASILREPVRPTLWAQIQEWVSLPSLRPAYGMAAAFCAVLIVALSLTATNGSKSSSIAALEHNLLEYTTYSDASRQQPELIASIQDDPAATYVTGAPAGQYETVVTF